MSTPPHPPGCHGFDMAHCTDCDPSFTCWSGDAACRKPDAERDWPEDFAHENGRYLCGCLSCGNRFYGYKRRMCCKVCATAIQATQDERDGFVAKAGLDPASWTLMTTAEVSNMHGLYAGQLFKLNVEKRIRQQLVSVVEDVLRNAPHAWANLKEALERVAALDAQPNTTPSP